jgi:hypothetical protein
LWATGRNSLPLPRATPIRSRSIPVSHSIQGNHNIRVSRSNHNFRGNHSFLVSRGNHHILVSLANRNILGRSFNLGSHKIPRNPSRCIFLGCNPRGRSNPNTPANLNIQDSCPANLSSIPVSPSIQGSHHILVSQVNPRILL